MNKYALLKVQQRQIEDHFDFLRCDVTRENILVCKGKIAIPDCDEYTIKIEYVVGHEPKCTILSPKISPSPAIHMYRDHSVCLHYPPDMIWSKRIKIYQYTVSWLSEWIYYYEIYKISGIWEGKESPYHIREVDKNTNVDRPVNFRR